MVNSSDSSDSINFPTLLIIANLIILPSVTVDLPTPLSPKTATFNLK